MYEKLRTYILPPLIPPNVKVMVAVSGGPDSMALGHILWRYVREDRSRGISLVLTHVHHGVRKESDAEVELVQQMASEWGIPCIVHRFDAKKYAETMRQSFEEAAREWRYARWKEDMLKEDCTLLTTAHHLGDQAETILYRLLRGSGTAGLGGIYPSKGSIIRPLLTFTKADILSYCAREALPYALDRSNEEPTYVRNRIRLELLPVLERDYNPRIQEALGRTGELLRWDEDYLARQAEAAWMSYYIPNSSGKIGLNRDVFAEPAAILSRLLRRAAMLVSQEPRGLGFSYVTKIMGSQGKIGWMQDLPGMTVRITATGIWFNQRADNLQLGDLDEIVETPLRIGQWSSIPSLKLQVGLLEEWNHSAQKGDRVQEDWVTAFCRESLAQCPDPLVCRTRQPGDKMWFHGVGHKSLKKIFQEENISSTIRNRLPLIAVGTEVLWIPGFRQSDLFRPEQNSAKVYCLLVTQASGSTEF